MPLYPRSPPALSPGRTGPCGFPSRSRRSDASPLESWTMLDSDLKLHDPLVVLVSACVLVVGSRFRLDLVDLAFPLLFRSQPRTFAFRASYGLTEVSGCSLESEEAIVPTRSRWEGSPAALLSRSPSRLPWTV